MRWEASPRSGRRKKVATTIVEMKDWKVLKTQTGISSKSTRLFDHPSWQDEQQIKYSSIYTTSRAGQALVQFSSHLTAMLPREPSYRESGTSSAEPEPLGHFPIWQARVFYLCYLPIETASGPEARLSWQESGVFNSKRLIHGSFQILGPVSSCGERTVLTPEPIAAMCFETGSLPLSRVG